MIFEILTNTFNNLTNIYPFLSIFFSIILILGFYKIGEFFLELKPIGNIFSNISDLDYLKIFFGINFFLIFSFPIIIFQLFSKIIINLSAIVIFTIGLIYFLRKILNIKNLKGRLENFSLKKNINKSYFDEKFFIFFLFGFFLFFFAGGDADDQTIGT